MPDHVTRKKWDNASRGFDFMSSGGPEKRWAPHKKQLFKQMQGNILFLAAGTGLDFLCFPPKQSIVGIDISPKMLAIAQARANDYDGEIELMEMDVHEMSFADASFDQIFTSCTFCSVPNPVEGLRSLHRVLKPAGKLYMFEHTGSRYFPFNLMLNTMNPLSRQLGPEMNRNTVENVRLAGFEIEEVNHLFLDVVKTITAIKPNG